MDQGHSHRGERSGNYRQFRHTHSGILVGEIVIFLLSFGGLFLNLLVFYILAIRIKIFKIDSIISGLITIFDIVASITMLIRLIFKWVLISMSNYKNFKSFCAPTGILFFASTITAFDLVCVLGLIRCLVIVFNINLRSMFWTFIVVVLLVFNWAGASALEWNLPEISWSRFCRRRGEAGKTELFGEIESIKAIVMLIILIVSYGLIFRFYRKYYENAKKSSSADQHLINEISTQKKNTSLKLLLLILSYVIIYIPKFAIFILYNFTQTSPNDGFEMVSAVLYSMSSIVNASVLLFVQEETKQELQYIWTLVFHRAKTVLK
ncbi:hypothetical protein CONCODRAFT_77607 [Conidiobolus coronatus NRRL 28638]|uniref:G-protein coupled receptors family 1 profile domain-containing protein n=1 Tax=Conidiobolus coronatus (strain ATCC 28846 / CBS 209.66 / NRRL 28638) TaxID=796925 RepID=A0A137PD73_CONC2|nr:hypothetical protein CONCODRAFT_77607 [Conidiobolus coronatus NRRL 28638]|eukprot:KXN72891.1 hypothetical protein CONCODRAFT_77607 [Conidiobolus coronatus NRRL 28638]